MPLVSLLANKAFDAETTSLLGSTFDAAWERAETSNSLPIDKEHVLSMRELLAKLIIGMVERGERNPNRLIESALLRLRHDAGVGEASGQPPKADLRSAR